MDRPRDPDEFLGYLLDLYHNNPMNRVPVLSSRLQTISGHQGKNVPRP